METEVLIVGAGPTGLMLACQLVRRGIRPLVIDRHSGPARQTRAMAVHARTLEIYAKLGLAEKAIALGRKGNGANLWVGGRRRARIPLGDIGRSLSPYPFVLMLGQDDNERLLGEHLEAAGIHVEWNTELVSLTQHPDHVQVSLRQPDGTRKEVTAAHVAGCDGGRSTVRELNGISFPGAPYEQVFFVADTEAVGPMVPDELNVYLWRSGFHLFFPMRGQDRWRVIGILPQRFQDLDNLEFADLVPSIVEEVGTGVGFRSCAWFSTYRIQHRCTERFRKQRCFLLGDAAHVHSPMGGQGMNTGLQDAYNLAWKLALVVYGAAGDRLLDSYESERRKVAEGLLQTTDRAFRIVVSSSWLAGFMRTRVVARVAALAMQQPRIQRRAFRMLSQTSIAYPDSPLSRRSTADTRKSTGPAAGDRFPWVHLEFDSRGMREDLYTHLDDRHFNLLVVGQRVSKPLQGHADLLSAFVLPMTPANAVELQRIGIEGPAFYLLRPDGHVALAGREYEESAVDRWFSAAGISVPAP